MPTEAHARAIRENAAVSRVTAADARASSAHTMPRASTSAFDLTSIRGRATIQRKASIGAPDDAYEREADDVADKVMRMVDTSAPSAVTPLIQRKCAACEDEPEKRIQAKRERAPRDAVALDTFAATRATQSPGTPLSGAARAFFEPRFRRDFSAVRVHADADAAQAARSVQARAYTLGSDIVFGSGEYAPSTDKGRRLLAHELTHVIQQSGLAASGQSIQRAKLPYHPLTWADFKAPAPASAPEAAGILSAFDVPGPTVSPDAKKTKKKCKVDGRNDVEYVATVALDPAQFEPLAAYMDTDRSWLQDRLKDDGAAFCANEAARCERDFDASPDREKAMCEQKVDECKRTLRAHQAFVYESGGEHVTIDSIGDCSSRFVSRCQSMAAKQRSVRSGSAVATTKRDCKGTFLTQCNAGERTKKATLLKHEQGHFDISKTLADNARKSLKETAATLKFSTTACGQSEAQDAVLKLYAQPEQDLIRLGTNWQAAKDRAQDDYDVATGHGTKPVEQASWETKIRGGLRDYDPTAAAAASPTPAPPANAPPAAPPRQQPSPPPAKP